MPAKVAIGVTPTDRSQGIENPIPPHFNTSPAYN
jgi:hypothetical protein